MHQRPQRIEVTQLEPGDGGLLVKDIEIFSNPYCKSRKCSRQFLTTCGRF